MTEFTLADLLAKALWIVLAVPAVAAGLLATLPGRRLGAGVNVFASLVTLAATCGLAVARPAPGLYLAVDDLGAYLMVLTGFISFTGSIFSAATIGHETHRLGLSSFQLRLYHALYQALVFALLLALLASNIVLLWVAIELSMLVSVALVGLYRTHEALEAAWKYLILGSVGAALALFGTIFVYMVAQVEMGPGLEAMAWPHMLEHAAAFDADLLTLAFLFVLLGYGTKVALVPLHAWLPDALSECPSAISALLSGLALNVALVAVLRFKMVVAANPEALAPGWLMVGLGLLSSLFAAFMLYRRRDLRRLFAYSSVGHMGMMTFAFGLGGPIASFAGLLHMGVHSLAKSAVFFAVAHVVQAKGTQKIAEIRGLTDSHPALGWGLVLGVVAIAGLPPFGLFSAEFVLLGFGFAHHPVPVALLAASLLVALGALMLRLHGAAFGPGQSGLRPRWPAYAPMYLHLALALVAGLYLPEPLVGWLEAAAARLGGG